MTAGTRYRLVMDQGQERHVSSVVLGREESREHILAEAAMHLAAGWFVSVLEIGDVIEVLCVHPESGVRRTIAAAAFDPLTDVVR